MVPVNISEPEITRLPFVPPIAPAKVSAATLRVKVFDPRVTTPEPLPARLTMEIPLPLTPVISRVALLVMVLDEAIAPLFVRYRAPPLIKVAPLKPLLAERVNDPAPDLVSEPLPISIGVEIAVLPVPVTVNAILVAPTLPSTLKVPLVETLNVVGAAKVIAVSASPIWLLPPRM